jgi:AcrR family transcriptional regulator
MRASADVRRRPAQKRGELRVQQILDATEALILESGAEAVTTNHIAKRAGVNVGTLYHFFSNKAEIFLGVLARASSALETAVAEVNAAPVHEVANAETWIARLIEAQTRTWLARAASVRLYEVLRSQPETNSQVEASDERTIALYCEGLERFCPHIARGRRRQVARTVLIMSYALLEDAIFATTPREQQARIREIHPAVRNYLIDPDSVRIP